MHNIALAMFAFAIVIAIIAATAASSAPTAKPPRVLIAGSGIAGASTAFFLQSLMAETTDRRVLLFDYCCNSKNKKKKQHPSRDTTGARSAMHWLRDFWRERTTHQGERQAPDDLCSDNICEFLSAKLSEAKTPLASAAEKPAVEIVLAEKGDQVGGRVRNFVDGEKHIEIGASVYHNVNHFMSFFAEGLLLNQQNSNRNKSNTDVESIRTHPYQSAKLGIWSGADGGGFVGRDLDTGVVSILKLLWRYGLDPLRVKWCIDDLVNRLSSVYEKQILQRQSFDTAEELLDALGLLESTQQNFTAYFSKCAGVTESRPFIQEIAHALTRLNYGQNVVSLSALAGSVAQKGRGDEVYSVRGGNTRVVDALLKAARVSEVRTKTTVEVDADSGDVKINGKAMKEGEFDAVVVAFPTWDDDRSKSQKPNAMRKVTTHVTFVRNARGIKRSAFGDAEDSSSSPLPKIISTSAAARRDPRVWWRSIGTIKSHDGDHLFKIFSDERPTQKQLESVFAGDDVTVVQHVAWDGAYPDLSPLPPDDDAAAAGHSFFVSDSNDEKKKKKKKKPIVVYAGALERFVSTLETQAISAMNTALLLSERFRGGVDTKKAKKPEILEDL